MSYLYSRAEMAEMVANGWGENEQRYRPLPSAPTASTVSTGVLSLGFSESLARAYEARGYPKCAATVRELCKP